MMTRNASLALAIAVLFATASTAVADEPTKLAVLDLDSKGVEADLAQNLTDVVTSALGDLGVFEVLSRSDIERILQLQETKQILGCDDTACLAEIGGALGVALLISGSIGKVGTRYILSLVLIDSASARVLMREQREVADADALTSQTQNAARFLVRDLLAKKQGFLVVRSSETGADVEVDGRLVGVTPVSRLTLAGGPHTLRLAKKGFVTWARDIDIDKDEVFVAETTLVPSLEYIEQYDAHASTWRLITYGVGGLGAAILAGGIGGWMWNGGRADDYETDIAAANCGVGATGAGQGCDAFEKRRDEIDRFDLLMQVVGGVGLAALGTATALYFMGPQPGIYDEFKPADGASANVNLIVLPGGVAALGRVGF